MFIDNSSDDFLVITSDKTLIPQENTQKKEQITHVKHHLCLSASGACGEK